MTTPMPTSWVIIEIATGKVVLELRGVSAVNKINRLKYKAVPIIDYLVSVNGKVTA